MWSGSGWITAGCGGSRGVRRRSCCCGASRSTAIGRISCVGARSNAIKNWSVARSFRSGARSPPNSPESHEHAMVAAKRSAPHSEGVGDLFDAVEPQHLDGLGLRPDPELDEQPVLVAQLSQVGRELLLLVECPALG